MLSAASLKWFSIISSILREYMFLRLLHSYSKTKENKEKFLLSTFISLGNTSIDTYHLQFSILFYTKPRKQYKTNKHTLSSSPFPALSNTLQVKQYRFNHD